MDLKTINELIDEVNVDTPSLSTVRNLSALYIVKSYLLGTLSSDNIVKQLRDILPSYTDYVEVKTRYQRHDCSQAEIINCLKILCAEITDFLTALYSGTDCREERTLLFDALSNWMGNYAEKVSLDK